MSEERGKYATEKEDSLNNARAMIGWDKPVEILKSPDLRDYRIELPNLYDDAELDPFEFRLLVHYVRVGECTEGTRTTSKKCGMSPMSISEKRKSLHEKGFISLEIIPLNKGFSYRVSVVDKWQENFTKYAPVRQAYTPVRHVAIKKEEEAVNIFSVYEAEIGVITSHIANALQDWEKTVPVQWITDAIHEAATNNKRNWKYCEAILKRWQAQGNQDVNKKNGASSKEQFENALKKAGYEV